MNALVGSLSWLALTALALGACDDPKESCRAVAQKYETCAPKIVDDALAAAPPAFEAAVDELRAQQTAKISETVKKLGAQCDAGVFTDAEKRQFRVWRACVKKPCSQFTDCIAGR